jgi:DNA repair protein RAD16
LAPTSLLCTHAAAHHFTPLAAVAATFLFVTLLQVRWRRIILDEAHCIKDRACNTAKAVFALTSKYKWALSGTPLQVRRDTRQQQQHCNNAFFVLAASTIVFAASTIDSATVWPACS